MNILDSRILLKRSTTAGEVPTIPYTSNHTDGTWTPTDIYSGETFVNTVDQRAFVRLGSDIKEIPLQNSLVGTVQYASKTLTSAQILSLNTTPITIVPAPGANKYIVVKSAMARLNYNTTTYSAADLQLIVSAQPQYYLNDTIDGTFSFVTQFIKQNSAVGNVTDLQFLGNTALKAKASANPTSGNGTLDILVEYQILDFNSIF
jgi:hypothetical protein